MKNWKRQMNYEDTGLEWVLPSPNMPTLDTAYVYQRINIACPRKTLEQALNQLKSGIDSLK